MRTTQPGTIRNIVCIDDSEVDYFIFRKQLKLGGSLATTWYYSNPVLALKELRGFITRIEPDLFLIDYNMPEMNGIDCIKGIQSILREVYPDKNTPIILYSSADFRDVTLLKELEVGFIEKPILSHHIEAVLNNLIHSEKVLGIASHCL